MMVTNDTHRGNLAVNSDRGPGPTVQLKAALSPSRYHSSYPTILQLSSEMFSQLIRHTSTIFRRSHPFVSCSPSSLSALHLSPISRVYSWSSQSQPANWSHLSDIYSKAVGMRSREHPMSPDANWTTQSRSRMQNLRPPKGPYAGKNLPFPQTPRLSHISIQEGVSK